MKLETFFEKFDQLADATDAVVKMRELVLRMATSGRIAEQDSSDQPGSELLKEIFEVRDNLIKRGAAKSRIEGSPITAGDTIDLPPSWARCMISEVCDLQTGATPSRAEHSYFGGDTPWLVSGDINKGEITECDGRITEEGLENSNCKIIPANSVLIALNGQGKTRATVAVLRIEAALNQSLVAMIPYSRERLLPEYIFWNLRGRYYAIRDITGQDQRRGLNMKLVGQLRLPIPPLAEQKRIVAKVDELMALCDRLEAQQQERETRHAALARASLARFADAPTPGNLPFLFHPSYSIPPADLRKSILTLAVQGKLVPQDSNDGDARDMVDLAMDKRRETIKAKSLRRKELDESTDLFVHEDLPSSWCIERLAKLVDPENTISYGVLVPGNDVPDGIPFVRAQDLCLSNHPARPNKTIAPEIEKPYARTRVTGGEILLCVVGSIGKLGVVPDSWAGANIARAVARIKPIPDVLRDYLLLVLQEQSVQNYFNSATRTLAQPTLNVGMIEQTPIPVPPIAEQRRIVAKVDQLMALVDELETQLAASRATAANLLEAVVAELTTQA